MMEELIKVTVNDKQQQVVSARDIYKLLEVKKRFSTWFNVNSKFFIEGEDFVGVKSGTVVNNGAIKPIQDYVITLDMAKHIVMMSKTDKGKELRKYFIQLEEKWNDPQEIVKRGYELAQKLTELSY